MAVGPVGAERDHYLWLDASQLLRDRLLRDRRRHRVDRTIRVAKHRSEEHTSELQSQSNLVCRLLLEKKKKSYINPVIPSNLVPSGTTPDASIALLPSASRAFATATRFSVATLRGSMWACPTAQVGRA